MCELIGWLQFGCVGPTALILKAAEPWMNITAIQRKGVTNRLIERGLGPLGMACIVGQNGSKLDFRKWHGAFGGSILSRINAVETLADSIKQFGCNRFFPCGQSNGKTFCGSGAILFKSNGKSLLSGHRLAAIVAQVWRESNSWWRLGGLALRRVGKSGSLR